MRRLAALAGIVVMACGVIVFANGRLFGQEGGPQRGPHGPGMDMLSHLSKMLDLTDAQTAQIKAILESAHAVTEPIETKLDALRAQLDAATKDGQFDEAQVRGIANQQAQLTADMMVEHERMKANIFKLLTPEQRIKAEELHKHMRAQGVGMPWGPGHPGGPPPPPPPPGQE